MDRVLRAEIVAEVRRAIGEMNEKYNEQWVSGKELCKQVQCITASFLDEYGQTLPRERGRVWKDGIAVRTTGWVYPLHRIKRMIARSELKELRA
jgi:hypothetical protein